MKYYEGLFAHEGFSEESDLENLKELTRKDLEAMGVTQRG